jgi:hydrogenase nickel incorporation protein HypB
MEKNIKLKSKVLAKNDEIADGLRARLTGQGIFCLNLIGSPGAGKTKLLETVLPRLRERLPAAVVEGDVKTDHDMQRILAAGTPAVQIETGGGCHLNAEQIVSSLEQVKMDDLKLLIIENVGNLICPVSYQLGEHQRMIVLSITEGDDKPLKYPSAFTSTDMVVITKTDLAPYVEASVADMKANALHINPQLKVFETSARTGEGIDALCNYLYDQHGAIK